MVQNHALQLLTMIAMEPPATNDADAIRDEKLKVLRSLKPFTRKAFRATSFAASTAPATSTAAPCPATSTR
jgi:Glucose-6-phosphate 1-dehydrogenase